MIRRGAVIRLVAIGLVVGLITTLVAVLIDWLPPSASVQMDRITDVYWFATIICIGVFSVVMAVILYSVWQFRAQPDDESDGPPIHGNTGLEIVWTIIPALLVVAIGVVSAVVLSKNSDAGTNPLNINVYAQQFAWRFEYPDDGKVKSPELVLPLDRTVKLTLESADVIHSFWIPEMGQKQDVVPGIVTTLVITPTRTGRFTLVCTELCGLGHATMRAPVRVVPREAFTEWVDDHRAAPGGGGAGGAKPDGKAVFAANGCGGCHTFTPAGSDGEIGPSLDGLTDAAYVKQSITDPNADIVGGYQGGVMPGTFAKTLSPEEIDALVQYLTQESP